MDIHEQEKALHQALEDLPFFALGPHPRAGRHRQRFIVEFEGGLPTHLRPGRGCNVCPDLGGWLRSASQFPDRDPARHSKRGLSRSVARNPGRLIDDVLFLFCTTGRGRRRSLIFALRLLRLSRRTCARQESVNGHHLPSHHFFPLVNSAFKELIGLVVTDSAT